MLMILSNIVQMKRIQPLKQIRTLDRICCPEQCSTFSKTTTVFSGLKVPDRTEYGQIKAKEKKKTTWFIYNIVVKSSQRQPLN